MYKISVYIPYNYCDRVKSAMFKAGAGQFKNYDRASWQTEGTGQFRPLEGSDPYLGTTGELETVQELKVEMICSEQCIKKAIGAMKEVHPYEEPAYDVIRLEKF